jgi:Type II secretion system protein B
MSYILDALRKAAEQRGSTTSVLFRPAPTQVGVSRSWRVPWIVVGSLLVVNVAVLVWVFRPASGPDLPPPTASESSAAPAVALAPPPAIRPSESPGALAPPAAVPAPGPADLRPPPHAATVRGTPKTPPPPATARPSAATRAMPAEPPVVAPVQPSAPPVVESPAPPRTRAERRAAAVAEPTTQPTREATAASPPAPKAPGNRGALKLEVISFSDTPAQRLVFISGRKYVEGDTTEGGFRIEQIKEDSVVLSDQGVRFTLR